MAASNWNQSPSTIILDLVAAANSGFDAVRSNFTFKATSGNPITTPPSGSSKNTGVVITPTEAGSATYEGDVTIGYNRLGIDAYAAALNSGNPFSYTADPDNGKPALAAGMSVADTQAVINSVLGLKITSAEPEFDSAQFAVTKSSDTEYSIALVSLSSAFLFTGSFTLLIDIPVQKTQTSSVVSNTDMDGLNEPSNG